MDCSAIKVLSFAHNQSQLFLIVGETLAWQLLSLPGQFYVPVWCSYNSGPFAFKGVPYF